MKRSLVAVLVISAAVAAGVASCNSPACGPGTKQVQQKSGELRCEPVDAPMQSIVCETDGGAVIKGGVCTSRTACGPNTEPSVLPTGEIVCVGTGTAGCTCSGTPEAGKICVVGSLFDFATNTPSTKRVRYAAYEPLAFLAGGATPLAEDTNDKGCYSFVVPTPASNLIAIAVEDPLGVSPKELQLTGTGARVPAAAKNYKVDVFFTLASIVQGWKAQSGANLPYDTKGVYVGFFYNELAPADPTEFLNKETMPQSGVKLTINMMESADTRYFGADRLTLDSAATATSMMVGGAVTLPPPSIASISGTGGICDGSPCKWTNAPGSSAPNVVFISRFHKLP